tara:strand:- start:186 stop:1088 length:903 start_codon:yes stop_codon:yes gene_type:complete
MSENIIITPSDFHYDGELRSVITAPLSILNPRDSRLTLEQRRQVLKEKYQQQVIADGLDTGHLTLDANGQLLFKSKQSLPTFKGFIFEALTVRLINENLDTVGKRAFAWCTERKNVQNEYLKKFTAFGRGFKSTKHLYPGLHNTVHKFDVQFMTMNEQHNQPEVETIVNSKVETGIQVKAITGNERAEIIEPLLRGEYQYVLTYLKHADGIHSYIHCMNIIREMFQFHEITHEQRCELERRIYSPEHLGISQADMDEYSYYINDWWRGREGGDTVIGDAMKNEITNYRKNGSILVPINMR